MISAMILCVALNAYHEARSEPYTTQVAVARVAITRSLTGDYPSNVCNVVYQPNQFSWTKKKKVVKEKEAWEVAQKAAKEAFAGKHVPFASATHFHHVKAKPAWRKKMQLLGRLGEFFFYREVSKA